MLGFLGYVIATAFCVALALRWDFTIQMRAVALIAPPLAFTIVVIVATALKGREWIVFYQTTIAAVVSVALLGVAIGAPVWRLLDCSVLGIGVFLVFGRLGCFHVACCHGRPAKRGVAYRAEHADAGFWRRWVGRPLVPVQLIESVGSGMLVMLGLFLSDVPGRAALVYGTGYAVMRFLLELWRGDPVRPFVKGLSEAQWFAMLTLAASALARPSWWTLSVFVAIAALATVLVARRTRRELLLPQHLRAIDVVCDAILADPAHAERDTALGVSISYHQLPDGRRDWIMSSTHPSWSVDTARELAALLWRDHELVEGRTPGLVHVLVP